MTTAHLTEMEIQLYVAEPKAISDELKAHVQDCELCEAKAANYALLFKSIHDTAKPAFDFDLSALVMKKLPAPKTSFPWAAILVSVFSVVLVAMSVVLFWSSMVAVIRSVSMVLIAAAGIGAVVVLIFHAIEMLKDHQRRMNTLLSQKTLQL